MSNANRKNPPSDPQPLSDEQNPLPLNPQSPADASVSDDAPGRAELEQLAQQDQPAPAGAQAGAGDDIREVVVLEKHRVMATFVFGAACDGLQAVMPIRYSDETRGKGAEALAPVVAKYEDVFPDWYLRWKEEIAFGMFMAGFIGGTVREVKRVQAIEADVAELQKQYVERNGLTRAEARKRALADLGYTEGQQPAAAGAT